MIKENFKFPLLELVELVIGNPRSRETLIQKLNQDEHHIILGKSFQSQPLLVLSNLNFKFLVCSFQYLILRLDSYQKTQQSLGMVWARPQVILVFEQKKSLAKPRTIQSSSSYRSDEGLTLETSAFKLFTTANLRSSFQLSC